jgi:hypothetical protein
MENKSFENKNIENKNNDLIFIKDNEKNQKNHFKFKPRTYFVKKLNFHDFSKDAFKSEIYDYFNSPDKFLDINKNIQINRKINIKQITPLQTPSQKEKQSNKESMKNTRNNSKLTSSFREKHLTNNIINNKDTNISIKKAFETIDNEKLKNIFKSYQNNIYTKNKNLKSNLLNEKSRIKPYISKYNDISKEISIDLNIQNKRLINKRNLDKQRRNISKFLSKKLHKNESDLLLNGVHLYRYKKEILDNDENDKLSEKKMTEQSCSFQWISSLRRNSHYFGKKESYINVAGNNNPLWSIVVERYPRIKEVSVQAGYNLDNRDFRDFKRKRNLSSLNSARLENVENLDQMSVKGKKLFNVEYDREMSSNNSKILHKVFLDNGKVILYKDINDIFGDKTIYKNYNFHNNKRSFVSKSQDNLNLPISSSNSLI